MDDLDLSESLEECPAPALAAEPDRLTVQIRYAPTPKQLAFHASCANEVLFGVNLYKAGLAEKVEGYLMDMLQGPGTVRATLQKYLA